MLLRVGGKIKEGSTIEYGAMFQSLCIGFLSFQENWMIKQHMKTPTEKKNQRLGNKAAKNCKINTKWKPANQRRTKNYHQNKKNK